MVSWWTLWLGTVAAVLAVVSGYVTAAATPVAEEISATVEYHRYAGVLALSCFAVCAVWRGRRPGSFPSRHVEIYWTVSTIGLGSLLVGAYFGGILVFRFGIGVIPPG